jgi:hypothetical protein
MPLILPTLQSELIDIYNKGKIGNPFPAATGIKTGKAYFNYVSAGINAGGGAFTSMPGGSVLGGDLAEVLSKVPTASGNITASNMATAFDTCLSTFLSVHQTTIVTIKGGLHLELMELFSAPKGHASLYATALGRALHNFTLTAQVIGVVPDTPGIPFTGPIS